MRGDIGVGAWHWLQSFVNYTRRRKNGQDGSYLAELLLGKGYLVHGIVRRSSSFNTERIEHLYRDPHNPDARLFLHYGDLVDGTGLREVLSRVEPHEIYNLGAQSHVRVSFDQPVYTVQ